MTADELRAMSPVRGMAMREYRSGSADELGSKQELLRNVARTEAGIQREDAAGQQLADVQSQKAVAQNKVDQGAVDKAREQEERMAAIAQQGQMAADAQMKRIMSAADDVSQASIHNFWQDKSAGSRILGVLSQAFAGAANALAGNPSAPTPLDHIINRDMDMQVANLNQKNKRLQNEQGVLKDLYDRTGNAMQATSSMYVAAWKRIDLQGAQLASKFGSQEAQVGYQKLHAIAEQRISQATDKTYAVLHSDAVNRMQHGMDTELKEDMIDAKEQAASGGTPAQNFNLAGVKGEVSEPVYSKFQKADSNYREFVKQAEHVDWLFKHGSGSNAADFQDYKNARASMFFALKELENAGQRADPEKLKQLEAMLPSMWKAEVPGYSGLTDSRNQLRRIMDTVSRDHFSRLDGTISGVTLDATDPQYGHHVARYLKQTDAERRARESDNAAGR